MQLHTHFQFSLFLINFIHSPFLFPHLPFDSLDPVPFSSYTVQLLIVHWQKRCCMFQSTERIYEQSCMWLPTSLFHVNNILHGNNLVLKSSYLCLLIDLHSYIIMIWWFKRVNNKTLMKIKECSWKWGVYDVFMTQQTGFVVETTKVWHQITLSILIFNQMMEMCQTTITCDFWSHFYIFVIFVNLLIPIEKSTYHDHFFFSKSNVDLWGWEPPKNTDTVIAIATISAFNRCG